MYKEVNIIFYGEGALDTVVAFAFFAYQSMQEKLLVAGSLYTIFIITVENEKR